LTPHSADGLAVRTTYLGEIAAVDDLCAALPEKASVVILSTAVSNRLLQAVRGMCDVPAAHLFRPQRATVRATVAGIRLAGRQPVLLAARHAQLIPFGGPARQIIALRVVADAHSLTHPPARADLTRFTLTLWMWVPGPAAESLGASSAGAQLSSLCWPAPKMSDLLRKG
ncbi:MAG: hypothetical protein ACRDNZ_06635, partial [Streptosporangiaceae bacterium]